MSDETFEGFVPPVDDYFRMPNDWINICAKMDSLSELKVVQYVLRHTWGYQGFSGARKITIDEFMHGRKRKDGSRIDDGTGLSKQSVITAVELAIKHGYLVCEKDDKDKARQKKYYQLAMKSDVKNLDPKSDVKDLDIETGVKNLDSQDVKDLDPDVKNLDNRGVEFRHRSEKDTIERHLEKNTLEKQESIAPTSLSAFAERKKTTGEHPAITQEMLADTAKREAIKPSKQKPAASADGEAVVQPPQSQVSRSPDVAPPASVGAGTAQTGAGQDMPAMALTPKQIAKQNEKRAKDIWAIIERELGTTFTQTQRKSDFNTKGMQNLIEDQISDEQLTTALSKLDDFGIKNFNLKRFHEMMPGLLAARKHNGKTASRDEPESFVSKTLDKERNDRRIQEMIEKSQKIRAERSAQAM